MALEISLDLPGSGRPWGVLWSLFQRSKHWPLSSMAGLDHLHHILHAAGRGRQQHSRVNQSLGLCLELSKVPIPPTPRPSLLPLSFPSFLSSFLDLSVLPLTQQTCTLLIEVPFALVTPIAQNALRLDVITGVFISRGLPTVTALFLVTT